MKPLSCLIVLAACSEESGGGIAVTRVDGKLFTATIDTSSPEGDTATGMFRIACVVSRGPNSVCL